MLPAILSRLECLNKSFHPVADACNEFQKMQKRLNQFKRRDVLRAGGLGLLGSAIPNFAGMNLQAGEDANVTAALPPGKAKACIFLFMWGGPSQLDTFDMKPNAPKEVRGEFQPIATAAPGVSICEHFEQLAMEMDKVAIIRSLNHTDPAHLSSGHAAVAGHWAPVVKSDADPPSDRDTPHMGSMMSHLRPTNGNLPASVTMPWLAYHPSAPGGQAPGQHGGWLGRQYDPLLVKGDPSQPTWKVPALTLAQDLPSQRLQHRRNLLRAIDRQQQKLLAHHSVGTLSQQQDQVFDLLTSSATRDAFNIQAESDTLRDAYGRNIHGQSVLLARRLVERGVPFVSVNWHNDGRNFWDTHGNNFVRLKNELIPTADHALATLLKDLDERGLLDSTIVAWVGEFGRRPIIDTAPRYAGRPHWPRCYSGLLAGGGIKGGQVFGSSDKQAAHPETFPVSPLDYASTIYHALGVPHEMTVNDKIGRPMFVHGGKPIMDLFG